MSSSGDDRGADAEQQPDDAPAQPQRHGDAARQATLAALVERRQPLGHDLGPQRRRRVERLGEVLGAREADELRAIDVDDVQGDGDARGAPGLGHELIGDEVGRDLVENVGDLERERLGAPEAAGRLIGKRSQPLRRLLRGSGVAAAGLLGEGGGQRLARREMAIERRASDAGGRGDLGHRRAAIAGQGARRGQDALAADHRVGAPRRRFALRRSLTGMLGTLRGLGHGGHRNRRRRRVPHLWDICANSSAMRTVWATSMNTVLGKRGSRDSYGPRMWHKCPTSILGSDMTEVSEAYGFRGRTMIDRDGDKIGKIDDVYEDKQTGRPEWALVNTGLFGTKKTFVPLRDAQPHRRGRPTCRSRRRTSRTRPSIDADGELSESEERQLYTHYDRRRYEHRRAMTRPATGERPATTLRPDHRRRDDALRGGAARRHRAPRGRPACGCASTS